MNKVCLSGRLVSDPIYKKYDNGIERCSMIIANNVFFGKKKTVGFYKVISWGKKAELVKNYLKTGTEVYITGRLDQYRYEDENGKAKYDVSVILEEFNAIKSANSPKIFSQKTEENYIENEPVF